MSTELSKQMGHLLLSYSGPEADRVRAAIAKLAKDDIQKMEHYLAKALDNHLEVIRCADAEDIEETTRRSLQGMTVNERLNELGLFEQWDASLARKDRGEAISILKKCQLSQLNIDRIVGSEFKNDP